MQNKFHLAIPSVDIQDSMEFYSLLGCKIGRFNRNFCIIDFFGNQVVCHKVEDIQAQDELYPRHFGLILKYQDWYYMEKFVTEMKIGFYKTTFIRYADTPNEHRTFFLKDPSSNLIEFKFYPDERAI